MGGTVSRPKCVRGRLIIGALVSVLLWSLTGCVPPPSPMERLTDAAYDLNTATRFGRFDVAMGYVEPGKQLQFAHRHAKWGQAVRVLDVDLERRRISLSAKSEARRPEGIPKDRSPKPRPQKPRPQKFTNNPFKDLLNQKR